MLADKNLEKAVTLRGRQCLGQGIADEWGCNGLCGGLRPRAGEVLQSTQSDRRCGQLAEAPDLTAFIEAFKKTPYGSLARGHTGRRRLQSLSSQARFTRALPMRPPA